VNPPLERSSAADAARHALCWATWPSDLSTPVRAFLALRSAGHRPTLLESVEGPERLARWSFLCVDPSASLRSRDGRSRIVRGEHVEELELPALAALRQAARARRGSLPCGFPPFAGGWVGWFSYEWSRELERSVPLAAHDPWQAPSASFELYERLLAFDHAAQRLFVIARCEHERDYAAAQLSIEALAADVFAAGERQSGPFTLAGELETCTGEEEYRRGVSALREAIAAGEVFQAVLARRFEQRFAGDAFTLYRVLRLTNPSPHMFFHESDEFTLIGSSPERLLSVREGRVENRPIAGTRPRGADAAEDDRLGAELLRDPKERAEHEMLVDLARNDLGRVARVGTVHVREHARLERFAQVQHLVSRVECELAAGRDALDALAASFPAGTVSGAPKLRAQQLLAGLERDTRGPYAGCFGYLDLHGNLDMALTIRSFVARGGVLSVQAGAGVVFDSDPQKELEETAHKASALLEAARLAGSECFLSAPPARSPR
jgi:anthranilate synthase component 1